MNKADREYRNMFEVGRDYLPVIITSIGFIIAGAVGYANLDAQTKGNSTDITVLKSEYQSVVENQSLERVQLSQIETDLTWLKSRPIFK